MIKINIFKCTVAYEVGMTMFSHIILCSFQFKCISASNNTLCSKLYYILFHYVCILAIITMLLSSFFPQDNRGEQSFKFELVCSKELVLQMHLTTFLSG